MIEYVACLASRTTEMHCHDSTICIHTTILQTKGVVLAFMHFNRL